MIIYNEIFFFKKINLHVTFMHNTRCSVVKLIRIPIILIYLRIQLEPQTP